jgi:predicted amidohydrolase YtcJ
MDFDTQATLFTNGRILTMADEHPHYAQALVIQYGRIAFVGDLTDALAEYPEATVHDLEGFTLMPAPILAEGVDDGRVDAEGPGAEGPSGEGPGAEGPEGLGFGAAGPLIAAGAEPYEALRDLTLAAARARGEQTVRGSLEVAKVADLVLLAEDPLAVAPEEVAGIAVVATVRATGPGAQAT